MTSEKDTIRNALNEVKWTLTTPIKPASSTRVHHSSGPENSSSIEESNKNDSSSGTQQGGNAPQQAPIGTNRYQNENNTSSTATENNRYADSLFQQIEQHPKSSAVTEDTGGDELTVWIIRVIGKGKKVINIDSRQTGSNLTLICFRVWVESGHGVGRTLGIRFGTLLVSWCFYDEAKKITDIMETAAGSIHYAIQKKFKRKPLPLSSLSYPS